MEEVNFKDIREFDLKETLDGTEEIQVSSTKKVNLKDQLENTLSELDKTSKKPVNSECIVKELKKKVDKVEGKELSTNDYTNEYKALVEGSASSLFYSGTVEAAYSVPGINGAQVTVSDAFRTKYNIGENKEVFYIVDKRMTPVGDSNVLYIYPDDYEGCYFVMGDFDGNDDIFSLGATKGDWLVVQGSKWVKIATQQREIAGFRKPISVVSEELKYSYIRFDDGAVVTPSDDSRRLDTFNVEAGQLYLITCRSLGSASAVVAFYNSPQMDGTSYMSKYSIAGGNTTDSIVVVVPNDAVLMCISSLRNSAFPYQVLCSSVGLDINKYIDFGVDLQELQSNAQKGKISYKVLDISPTSIGEPLLSSRTYEKLIINKNGRIQEANNTVFRTMCYTFDEDKEVNVDQFLAGYSSYDIGGVFIVDSYDQLVDSTKINTADIIVASSSIGAGENRAVNVSVFLPKGRILCVTHSTYVSGSYCNVYDTIIDSRRLAILEAKVDGLQVEVVDDVKKILDVDAIVDKENPLAIIRDTAGYTSIFRKIGVIGGSMSSGQHSSNVGNDSHDDYPYSTLQFMARMCGAEGYNFSRGGMSAREWCANTSIGGASEKFVNNPCQMYLIQLGNNDMSFVNPESSQYDPSYSIGSISDVMGKDGVFADTFYGRMGEIIHRIRAVQPRAYVFISTFLDGYGTVPPSYAPSFDYNQAARNIVDYFRTNKTDDDNIHYYLLDIHRYGQPYGYYDSGIHAGTVRGSHLVATGYLHWAWEYCTYIDWVIKNNMSDFNDVAFVGTDLGYNM